MPREPTRVTCTFLPLRLSIHGFRAGGLHSRGQRGRRGPSVSCRGPGIMGETRRPHLRASGTVPCLEERRGRTRAAHEGRRSSPLGVKNGLGRRRFRDGRLGCDSS